MQKSGWVQDWPVGFVVNFVSQYAGFYKSIAINWVTIEFSAFAIILIFFPNIKFCVRFWNQSLGLGQVLILLGSELVQVFVYPTSSLLTVWTFIPFSIVLHSK